MIEGILQENRRRLEANSAPFNPLTGENSTGKRFRLHIGDMEPSPLYLPVSMENHPLVALLRECGTFRAAARRLSAISENSDNSDSSDNPENSEISAADFADLFQMARASHDFPFWAAAFARIKPKGGGEDIPFILNRPQRKLVEKLEEMRLADEPIRLVLLKARQWGGSTCVQLFAAWLQLTVATGLNSLIIAHQSSGSDEIKDMFDRMLNAYPPQLLEVDDDEREGETAPLKRVGSSGSIFRIESRNCKIKVGTAERPDSSRGGDYNLVHLSEVGLWKRTKGKMPEDIVRSACSGVLLEPLTMIVLESTANGAGTFFHREYLAASEGKSQFKPLFVSWFEIDAYTRPLENEAEFAETLLNGRDDTTAGDRRESGAYLWSLWERGATLEAINWYISERRKYSDHAGMAAEYPSDDIEAFAHSGERVFGPEAVERMRKNVKTPLYIGEIGGRGEFTPDSAGSLEIWRMPEPDPVSNRYLAVVDVGGRSDKADWSVVAVFDRCGEGGMPEIVAQWRGHTDHDLLAANAARIAAFYNDALLVIESNTLESRDADRDVDGDQAPYLLRRLGDEYPNLYFRQTGTRGARPGFHTNVATKPMVIGELVRNVREGTYVERDTRCLDELLQYERKPNGSFGAISGCHDDILMTRAIGLYISTYEMGAPAPSVSLKSSRHHHRPSFLSF